MDNRPQPWAKLFLMLSILFGAIVRFAPTIMVGAPINDGGMFYAMIEDLKANHFLLPAFTSYNHLNIPFAYPPLSFYIGGILSSLGAPTIEVIRWLPPLISTLSILAFYWMASLMLDSQTKAALAVLAYALMPRSFSWYVMGGGLSRTFGVLFLLLACASVWALFTKRSAKYIFLTALFGAGAVLSHPETGLHTVAACALIWLFKGCSWRGLRDAALVAVGVFVLTSPWWGTVLVQHGWAPFQSALHSGGYDSLLGPALLSITEERFVPLVAILGLIGSIVQCLRRDFILPAWALLPFLVEPRSATAISALALAMLAAVALADFVVPKIATFMSKSPDETQEWTVYTSQSGAVRILLGLIMFLTFVDALTYDLSLANYVVNADERAAMAWVNANTPPASKFIVLTGRPDPFGDPSVEWFPTLASRTSQNTLQGREWILGSNFVAFSAGLGNLQRCLNANVTCLDRWAAENRSVFNFIYIEISKKDTSPLLAELKQGANYMLVFENDGAMIFERK